MPASPNAAFDPHSTDPTQLKVELRAHLADGHSEKYKGRAIHVIGHLAGYKIEIDEKGIPGNFLGVLTAVQRARTLIDRNEV